MISVTKTYLPNKDKFKKYVDQIYDNGWITNNGPMVRLLEEKLSEYFGVKNIVLVSNGTVALEIAYRALGISGEAITTPFSFVATSSSMVTNDISPIFSDIDKHSLNIDVDKIEKLISRDTEAIVPVHVFGNVCEIEKLDKIAKRNNLKIIYDAAHAFGVKYKGNSVLNYGNISTLSFHATKLFHTIEGGALVVNDDSLVDKVRYLRNFGIKNTESIPELGINAKMNEFQAAMGLCILDDLEIIFKVRKNIHEIYMKELCGKVSFQKINKNSTLNYSYLPIILKTNEELLRVQKALNEQDIYPRRYFYPSLDTLDYIEPKQFCKISRDISSRIICLPVYPGLKEKEQRLIIKVIKDNI